MWTYIYSKNPNTKWGEGTFVKEVSEKFKKCKEHEITVDELEVELQKKFDEHT